MALSDKSITFNNVGTDWEELELSNFPDRFTIIRAKAEIKSGSGSEVALSIRTRSEPTDSDYIALEYSLVETLDYIERQVVRSYKVRDTDVGKLFIAVKANSGSDNKITVLLEYQVL